MTFSIRRLAPDDIAPFRALLETFAEAFEDRATYTAAQPDDAYIRALLAGDQFIALVAIEEDAVVAGLTAYELKKFEQARSEVYIYDLAVDAGHRRRGIATALIEHLKPIAKARGAHVIIVQAEQGDEPPIAVYTKLGRREDVLHFDIPVD